MVPMFPLGSVLLPAMPLPLQLFEQRYLAMLDVVMEREGRDFGVVLIERGSEVGGGDTRFGIGTMARVLEVQPSTGPVTVLGRGTDRFRVDRWLEDDPWPQAEITLLPALEWDEQHRAHLEHTESVVRRTLSQASEFVQTLWDPGVELNPDPVDRAWQLAGICLAGPLDQAAMLGASSVPELCELIEKRTLETLEIVHLQVE